MKDRSDDPLHHERTLLPRSYISLHLFFSVSRLTKKLSAADYDKAEMERELEETKLKFREVKHKLDSAMLNSQANIPVQEHLNAVADVKRLVGGGVGQGGRGVHGTHCKFNNNVFNIYFLFNEKRRNVLFNDTLNMFDL